MVSTAATCWPSPLQENLLRAALLDGEAASRAWLQWRAEVDLDHIDPESYPILAPLSANLGSLGVEGPLTSLLKGVRRQTWASTHHLMKVAVAPLRMLDAAGIPLLLLEGAALALGYYRDFGMRAFSVVDVLVPGERVREAMTLLEESGWAPVLYDRARAITENYLLLGHAIRLRNCDGMDIELHWHVLPESCDMATDEAFWRASQAVGFDGLAVRVLGPADQLLHAMADGIRIDADSKLSWMVDALAILRMSDTRVDWDRVIAMVQRLQLVLLVRDALVYLRDRLAAPVPSEVIAQLNVLPATRTDRLDYRLRTSGHRRTLLNGLGRLWVRHRRLSGSTDAIRLLGSFPRFLQRCYDLDSPWQLPAHTASRVLRRRRSG